jgi:hypothetical protein
MRRCMCTVRHSVCRQDVPRCAAATIQILQLALTNLSKSYLARPRRQSTFNKLSIIQSCLHPLALALSAPHSSNPTKSKKTYPYLAQHPGVKSTFNKHTTTRSSSELDAETQHNTTSFLQNASQTLVNNSAHPRVSQAWRFPQPPRTRSPSLPL